MPGPHDRIIGDAAKAALGPLHFRRKGRSRTWMADHGWWVTVVEFQPSAWSKGSYLNVAAHWLWSDTGHLSFDFGGRVAEHVEYLSDPQFVSAVASMAASAAKEAEALCEKFTSLSVTAEILLGEARRRGGQGPGHPGWMTYHAGVASGLAGRGREAAEMFARIRDSEAPPGSILHPAAERMAQLAYDPLELKRAVLCLIETQREALRLPPRDQVSFQGLQQAGGGGL